MKRHEKVTMLTSRETPPLTPLTICVRSDYIWSGNIIKIAHMYTHRSLSISFWSKIKTNKLGFTVYLNNCNFLASINCSTYRILASLQRFCSSPLSQRQVYPLHQSDPPLSPQASSSYPHLLLADIETEISTNRTVLFCSQPSFSYLRHGALRL